MSSSDGTAYINGRVYTVNESQEWAEAFVVLSDGTFGAVDTNANVLQIAKRDQLPVYDLKDAFIMPGIHDAHVHLLASGYTLLNEVSMGMDATTENVSRKIHDGCCGCAYANVYSDWIIGNGLNIANFDRAILDKDYPNTPVIIRVSTGHTLYANTTALIRSGIDPDNEPDTQASIFMRRTDGSLTGELSETAMDKVILAIPYPKVDYAKRSLKHAIQFLHQSGVTSLQEAASNTVMLKALNELDREGGLKVDVAAHITHSPQYVGWESRESLHKLLDEAPQYLSPHVDTRFLKVILDGLPLPPLFSHAELLPDGTVNVNKLTMLNLPSVIAEFDKKGVTCKVHCTGEGSVRHTLDAIEAARKANPSGPHHEIAHCNGIHDDDFARFQAIRCGAEMSPAFFFNHPLVQDVPFTDWDFAKMIKNNAHVTIGSDWSGAHEPSLFGACARVFASVDEASSGKGGETLCRMLTINGAKSVGKEKEVGSIEAGKKANFIAMSRNLVKENFTDAEVLKTWFEGEIVWEKAS